MKKIEKENSIIEIFDTYVVKTLKYKTKDLSWFDSYQQFSKNSLLYTKILDFDESKIVMEKHDILMPVNKYLKFEKQLDRNLCLDIANSYFTVINDCIGFSKQNKLFWTHNDLTIDNFIITNDRKLKLIDPDGFSFSKTPIDYKYSFGVIELQNLLRDKVYV